MLNTWALLPFAAFLACSFAGVFLIARQPASARNRAFFAFVGMLALWALLDFFSWSQVPSSWELTLHKLQTLAWTSVGALFLHFAVVFVDPPRRRVAWGLVGLAGLGVVLSVATELVEGPPVAYGWGTRASHGPLYLAVILSNVLVPFGYAIGMLVQVARRSTEASQRAQVRILLVGVVVILCLALFTDVVLPHAFGYDAISDSGASLAGLFAVLLLVVLLRYDFLVLRVEDTAVPLLEGARDGVVLLGRHGSVERMNRPARELLGDGELPEDLLASATAGSDREVVIPVDQEERVLSVSATTIHKGAEQAGTLLVLRDVTERRRAEQARLHLEEQLRQAQKMEALGRLAGGVAHDFNNLLSAILGYAELIREEHGSDLPPEVRPDLEEIQKAARRASALTHQLLAFSRKEVTRPQVLELNEVVADVDRMLRRVIGEDVELSLVLEPKLGRVEIDRGQIEQVLVNLVVNARDAMPGGGRLEIQTSNLSPSETESYLGSKGPRPAVCLAIRDSGVGMPPEVVEHIFEPFFTTKEAGHGTGLGLSTVYGIIRQAGGHIEAESTPGEGSTFTIVLPAVFQEQSSSARSPRRDAFPSLAETVLLVEDEPSVRALARRMLERAGYAVLVASSGPEALALSLEYRGPLHLLLSDVIMPGMSGKELADELRHARPGLPVLFMSGYTDDILAGHEVVGDGILLLQKPFDLHDLLSMVRTAIDSGTPSISIDRQIR